MPDEAQSASTPPPEPAGSPERLAEPTLEQMRRWAEWRIVCQTPEGEQLPLLLGWLKTKHARRNAVAGYLLGRLGPPVVQALVRETFRARRQPSCQLRLLGVMERIAAPLGLDEFLALASLLSVTGDQQVRAAIARILQARHGAGAGDPTPAPGSSPGPAPQAPEESGAAPRPAARR